MDSKAGRIRLPVDESEVAEVSKEMLDQSRSHFYGVWRIFEGDKIVRFFAEMHKPVELRKLGKGANINIKENFATDVQATIAYCVMRHLFKTCVAEIRGKENASKKKKPYTPDEEKGGGLTLQCHIALVKRWLEMGNGRSLRDYSVNFKVAVF